MDVVIDSNQIKDKEMFNNQLNKLKKNESHNIMYCIEVIPENNPYNMSTVGMLYAK